MQKVLDYMRTILYGILIAVGLILFQFWNKEHESKLNHPEPKANVATNAPSVALAPTTHAPTAVAINAANLATGKIVSTVPQSTIGQILKVTTDVLEAEIDTQGGDIVGIKLLKYPESLNSSRPFLLLNHKPSTQYIAESGLLSELGPDTPLAQATYVAKQTNFVLADNKQNIEVPISWENGQGLTVIKTFYFKRGSYEIGVAFNVNNGTNTPWQGHIYTQLLRTNTPPTSDHSGLINLATFFGAAISTPSQPFTKINFADMNKIDFSQTSVNGWAAMIQHYFISAWIPAEGSTSNYYSKVTNNGLYTIGMIGEMLKAAPNGHAHTKATLYAGPAIAQKLQQAAPNLKLAIDYGWFWMISEIIFWMMQCIYNVIGNWGWAIVLVTVIIKILFYPLSVKSFKSMSAIKKIQPKIEALKQEFGEDRQALTNATLKLYRQEKVNPMSGCLPILVQIPVFIALYWVLVESVELRQAPFILWIHDLSQQDPYYVLPLLMGISMFIQQSLNPPPPDPMQAKLMMLMPVIFTILFANFPAGLMLYWFVNNTLSFLQQWFVMRKLT